MATRRGTSSTSCPQQTHRDANDININDCIIKENDEPKLDENLEIEQNKRIEAEIIMERLDSI